MAKVTIDTEQDTLLIDSLSIPLELLRQFADPDPTRYFCLVRNGDCIMLTAHASGIVAPSGSC